MVDDFFNGLHYVPLDEDHSFLSSLTVAEEHPWRYLFQERTSPPERANRPPASVRAPARYTSDGDLAGPPSSSTDYFGIENTMPQHTVRLCDVQTFRNKTAEKASADPVNGLSAGLNRLSTRSTAIRPVIYRYIDSIRNSLALLEAIHFELFMPDRPDLRFLAVPFATIPAGTVERDFFQVNDAQLLANASFSIKLGDVLYPVLWEAQRLERMTFADYEEKNGMAYIVKRKTVTRGGELAVSEISFSDFFIRSHLFPDQDSRMEHSLVHVTMKTMV